MMRKLMCLVLPLCMTGVAYAGSGDDLAKELNNLIRKAENAFFSGHFDDADGALGEAAAALATLRSQDPGNKSLGSLETKYQRLKERVDQKRGQGTPAPKKAPPAAMTQAAADPEALKPGAVQTLANAGKEMDAAEASLAQARESLGEQEFNKFGTRIYKAEDQLKKAKEMLERAERSYKVGPEHAEVKPYYDRFGALEKEILATKEQGESGKNQAASQKQAAADQNDALDQEWLPRIQAFIRPTGGSYITYPMTNDPQKLAEQDRTLEAAQRLLGDYEKQVPAGSAGPQLEQAAANLRSAIENYRNQRNAGLGDMQRSVEDAIAQWERRFEENRAWKEGSDRSLFFVGPEKFKDAAQRIEKLKAVSPSEAAVFSQRLAKLETENRGWVEKRKAWESRPRPFPEAKMTSKTLEKEMTGLLADRGWKVERLVIVDKDWWVLNGEYRYMQAAVLSKDGEGPFWSYVSFKQNQHLAGYGPTELWETQQKIRLP